MKATDYLGDVVRYIKRNIKKGYTQDALFEALLGQGHSKLEIEKGFRLAREEMAREAPVLKTRPKITYEVVDSPVVHKPPADDTEKKPFWKKLFG